MYFKLIKEYEKKIYIGLAIFFTILYSYNVFTKIDSIKIQDFSSLKNRYENIKKSNDKLSSNIDKKRQEYKSANNYIIDSVKLQNNIKMLCQVLTEKKYLSSCLVENIISPYGYINSAKITIKLGNEVDILYAKYILSTLYKVKEFKRNGNKLEIYIFN